MSGICVHSSSLRDRFLPRRYLHFASTEQRGPAEARRREGRGAARDRQLGARQRARLEGEEEALSVTKFH